MNTELQTQLAAFRGLLIDRLAELQAEIGAADRAAVQGSGEAGLDEVRDTKDAAARSAGVALQSAQRQRDADEAALVAAALHRLDAGTYGECTDCGEPVALARLRAQPAAARCARCQTEHESAHRRA